MPARPTAPSRSTRRERDSEPASGARVDEIRLAALELFATLGYRVTTMADIGAAVGIRGPSIYKHVASKQHLLVDIMTGTMDRLLAAQHEALAGTAGARDDVAALVSVHVRHHALHRYETFVGNREIDSLDPAPRAHVLRQRARYETTLRRAIEQGIDRGEFHVRSARLASYAILDMGMGVSAWHRPGGQYSPDEVAEIYAAMALRLLDAGPGAVPEVPHTI